MQPTPTKLKPDDIVSIPDDSRYPGLYRVEQIDGYKNITIQSLNHGPRFNFPADQCEIVERFPDADEHGMRRALIEMLKAKSHLDCQVELASIARVEFQRHADIVCRLACKRGGNLSIALDDVYVTADLGDGWDKPSEAAGLIKISAVEIL